MSHSPEKKDNFADVILQDTHLNATASETETDSPLLLETNIDNMDSEIFPYVIDRLLEAGAHDAYLTPIIMKKGRPGIILSALVPPTALETALEIIYTETPTLGVRIQRVLRKKLTRELKSIGTSFGIVKIKEIRFGSRVRRVPEFEECKPIAHERGVALQEIREQINNELNS
ncbi:MAG TPA: nickel insertion protein [Candidatus Kapabacteria bacterium]|nr:nickel insertion protein [Candidatus Kapabacteria bacterium]